MDEDLVLSTGRVRIWTVFLHISIIAKDNEQSFATRTLLSKVQIIELTSAHVAVCPVRVTGEGRRTLECQGTSKTKLSRLN